MPDAMNHIDQWSSGGDGSINTDPNSIKVMGVNYDGSSDVLEVSQQVLTLLMYRDRLGATCR